jgi:hypothetical protein
VRRTGQVASLLANAFFCTFPLRNRPSANADLPSINFSTLYEPLGTFATQNCSAQQARRTGCAACRCVLLVVRGMPCAACCVAKRVVACLAHQRCTPQCCYAVGCATAQAGKLRCIFNYFARVATLDGPGARDAACDDAMMRHATCRMRTSLARQCNPCQHVPSLAFAAPHGPHKRVRRVTLCANT